MMLTITSTYQEGDMAKRTVVATVYSDRHTYEVVKVSNPWDTKFYVHRDGKPDSMAFPSLRKAVEAAQKRAS
jgi:hypothetical protein